MGCDTLWAGKDSYGQRNVRRHGLKWARPIMRTTRESGDCLHMFLSGDKYYIWNPIEGGVWEFMEMRRESRWSRTGAEVEPGLSRAEQNRCGLTWGRRWAGVKIPVVLQEEQNP